MFETTLANPLLFWIATYQTMDLMINGKYPAFTLAVDGANMPIRIDVESIVVDNELVTWVINYDIATAL